MIKTMTMVLLILSLGISVGSIYGQENLDAKLVIADTCAINIQQQSLDFQSIQVGSESAEGEITFDSTGNQDVKISTYVSDWIDTDGKSIIGYQQTKVSSATSTNYADKTALTNDLGNMIKLVDLTPSDTNISTYWQVLPILNADSKSFSGSLTQTINIVFECE